MDAAGHPVPQGADGASWPEPKLQGCAKNYTKPCRPTRAKQQRFTIISMAWKLFRANEVALSHNSGLELKHDWLAYEAVASYSTDETIVPENEEILKTRNEAWVKRISQRWLAGEGLHFHNDLDLNLYATAR